MEIIIYLIFWCVLSVIAGIAVGKIMRHQWEDEDK